MVSHHHDLEDRPANEQCARSLRAPGGGCAGIPWGAFRHDALLPLFDYDTLMTGTVAGQMRGNVRRRAAFAGLELE
jgi:hypothetical protein